MKDYNKSYKIINKKVLKLKSKQEYIRNKEKYLERAKKRYLIKRESILNYYSSWYKKNKDKVNDYQKKWNKQKRKTSKNFNIKCRLRANLRKRVLFNYYKKNKYNLDYNAIIEHLKPFPNNIANYHIDHIIPLSSFDLTNKDELEKAIAPENHQWLLKHDNLVKSNKVII